MTQDRLLPRFRGTGSLLIWAGSSVEYCGLYLVRYRIQVLVFPESQNPPTAFGQLLGMKTIPLDIGLEFGRPPLSVGLGRRAMVRTGVPEAPVQVDSDPEARKSYVRFGAGEMGDGEVHPISQSPSVEDTTYFQFQRCVGSRGVLHTSADRSRDGGWSSGGHLAIGAGQPPATTRRRHSRGAWEPRCLSTERPWCEKGAFENW